MERCLTDMLVQVEETKYLENFAIGTSRDIGYFQLLSVGIESL